MMNIFRRTASSMAIITRSTPSEEYDVVGDDLTTWELVSTSLSDDEDICSFGGDDVFREGYDVVIDWGRGDDAVFSSGDVVIGDEPEPLTEEEEEELEKEEACDSCDLKIPVDVTFLQATWVPPPVTYPVEATSDHMYHDDEIENADEDGDEDLYEDDVDEDLGSWKLKGRFEKQRMRKIRKRGGAKPVKSNKQALPMYFQNRPGCLAGKQRVAHVKPIKYKW